MQDRKRVGGLQSVNLFLLDGRDSTSERLVYASDLLFETTLRFLAIFVLAWMCVTINLDCV